MTRPKTEATMDIAKKDLSSPAVPLKTFEGIDKGYLKIGDELFLVIDEITSNDCLEENKLTSHQVENPSNTEVCIKEHEALSFIIRTETVNKDDDKIPVININDQNSAKKVNNSVEAGHTEPVQNVPEFLKGCGVDCDEDSCFEPESDRFSSPYPDFDESSFEYSFQSLGISSISEGRSSDIKISDKFFANQEHLVQSLIKEFKIDAMKDSDQKSNVTCNNSIIEKRNLLTLLKTNGNFNNNFKRVTPNKLKVKLKERKVLKKDNKNTINGVGEPVKAVANYTETSMELIKKYRLKELRILVEKLDINFRFSQNEPNAEASVIKTEEKSNSQNVAVDINRPSSKVNNLKKSVENNNKSCKINSFSAQELYNISVATEIVDDISEPKISVSCETDSLKIVVPNMRSFSDVHKIMIENNVKIVNIPENVYNLFKQENDCISKNSDLKIICSMSQATKNLHRPTMKRKRSGKDGRLEKSFSGNLPDVSTERFQKFPLPAVPSKKPKVGQNNMPKDMICLSNVEIGSSPKQSNLHYEMNKEIASVVSSPMKQDISKQSTLHIKKFKISRSCTEPSHKKLNVFSENKNELSESPVPNSQSQMTLNSDKNERVKNKLSHSVIKSSRKQMVSDDKFLKKIKTILPSVNRGNIQKQRTFQSANGKKIKVDDLIRISTKSSPKQLSLGAKNAIKVIHGSSNATSKTPAKTLFPLKKNGMIKEILSKYPTENSKKQTLSLTKNVEMKNDLFNPLADTSAEKLYSHSKNGKTSRENFFVAPVEGSGKQVSLISKKYEESNNNLCTTQKGAHPNMQFLQNKNGKKNKSNDKKVDRLIVSSSLWGAPIFHKHNQKSQSDNPCRRSQMVLKKVKENGVTQQKNTVSKNKAIKETILVHELPNKFSGDGNCKTFGVKGYVDMNNTLSGNLKNCTVISNFMKKTISDKVNEQQVSYHQIEETSESSTFKNLQEYEKCSCPSEKILCQICNANLVPNKDKSSISPNFNKNINSTKTPVEEKNIVQPPQPAGPTKDIEVESH